MQRFSLIGYRQLFVILAAVSLTITACGGSTETGEEGSSVVGLLTTATPQNVGAGGPTATRRPAPTPLPTEELVRPRSESPESSPPSIELSEEEQAELNLERFVAAHRNGLTVPALRANIATENLSSGESNAFLLEFVRPDSFRMVTDELDLIVTGGQTYAKDQTATWLVSPVEMTDRFEGLFDAFTNEEHVVAQLEEVTTHMEMLHFLGEESINDTPVQVFSYSQQLLEDEAPALTTVWIGAEDGLFYRQVVSFSLNNEDLRITTSFEYGDAIHVEAPLP